MNHLTLSRRDFLWRTSVAAVFSSVWIEPAWAKNANYVIAETSFGKVRGIESRGIKVFKRIHYGGNTGGSNRFMPSVDPASWLGIRDALNYGRSAPQSMPAIPRKITPPKPDVVALPRDSATPASVPALSIFRALAVPRDNPKTPKLPPSPEFNAQDRANMVFNDESVVVNDPLHEQRIAMFHAFDLS